jgi:hypothetical protein
LWCQARQTGVTHRELFLSGLRAAAGEGEIAARKLGSQWTPRWRATDSNRRSLAERPALLLGSSRVRKKKRRAGARRPRMRLGPEGGRRAKPCLPFTQEAEPNIPAGIGSRQASAKSQIFRDRIHGLSTGTNGSNPSSLQRRVIQTRSSRQISDGRSRRLAPRHPRSAPRRRVRLNRPLKPATLDVASRAGAAREGRSQHRRTALQAPMPRNQRSTDAGQEKSAGGIPGCRRTPKSRR